MGKKKPKKGSAAPAEGEPSSGPSTSHAGGGDAPAAVQQQQQQHQRQRPHQGEGDAPSAQQPQKQQPQPQQQQQAQVQHQQHPPQQWGQPRQPQQWSQQQQWPQQHQQQWPQQHQQQWPQQQQWSQQRQQQHQRPQQQQQQQQWQPRHQQWQPRYQQWPQQQQQRFTGQQQQVRPAYHPPRHQQPQLQQQVLAPPPGIPQLSSEVQQLQLSHQQFPPGFQQPSPQGVQQLPPGVQPSSSDIQQPVQQKEPSPPEKGPESVKATQGPVQQEKKPDAPKTQPKGQKKTGKATSVVSSGDGSKSEKGDEKLSYELPLAQRHVRETGGKVGRGIIIKTNHFALDLGRLERAVHYDVAIEPNLPKKALRSVIETFRLKHYPDRYPAFDGNKNLYSSRELPFGDQLCDEQVTIKLEDRDKVYKVTVKFATYVDLTSLRTYFAARSQHGDHLVTPQQAIQCIDIVLRSAPAISCIPAGRSFFTKPPEIIELGDGMEMYYGFYQSAILGWKPFLNVDVAHKAFPICQQVTELIMELYRFQEQDLKSPNVRSWDDLSRYIKTLKVQYEIPGQPTSKRVYRVNGLGRSPKEEKFTPENKPPTTILNYFRIEKNYGLKYPDLPCLWVGNPTRKPPILLPAELCTIMEGQDIKRKMNEIQTSKMIRYAATNTDVRKNKIMTAVQKVKYNENRVIREFGFSVSNEFETVNARVLPPPTLTYADSKPVTPSKGTWRGDSCKFFDGASLTKWTVACLDFRTRQDSLGRLASMIERQAIQMGMNVGKPQQPFQIIRAQRGRELNDISDFFQRHANFDLIIMVIPDGGPFYSYVKQAAELAVGCLTQCIKSRTLFKSLNASTIGNILLKMNAKLNGTNHYLSVRPNCLSRPCMIMGADVTHPSPEAKSTVPSVAAVTASHDPKAFKYNICWRLQEPRLEIIEDLENIVYDQLMFFYRANRQMKPERIVFFRDGVSEGQFQMVMNAEVQAIRRACARVERDTYKPKITFLVVQKRHHTRFFPTNPRDSEDRNNNVPAGTCVDTYITHPTAQDFYLVSHASIQGVAKPTKYRTLWDDNEMGEDEIEQLTYFLCHMFTRCNRSVSYPAPTYYAHLAAARAKVYCDDRRLNMSNLAHEQSRLQIKKEIVQNRPMFFV